jgi:hypothetical protein
MKRADARPKARFTGLLFSILMLAGTVQSQQFVSVKAGIIQFIQGEVFLDDKSVQRVKGSYLQIDNGHRLVTKDGRVEMLLAPDVYFRLDKNGSMQMVQNRFDDTKLQLEQGSALIEVDRLLKGNRINVLVSNAIIEIREEGLYRLDAGSSELRVYGGTARIEIGNKRAEIKKGRMVRLNGDLVSQKFNITASDPLHLWAAQRSFNLFISRPFAEKHKHWSVVSADWNIFSTGRWIHDNYQVQLSLNQNIASLFPGSIQYIKGEAFLDGKLLQLPEEGYKQIEKGQRLSTKMGYMELVLAPGIYLRLGKNGSLRMEQNQSREIRLELEQGSALIEVAQISQKDRISMRLSTSVVEFRKDGLYRVDAGPRELRVHSGTALVTREIKKAEIKKGKMVRLDGDLVSAKADTDVTDPLHRWAAQRSFELFIASPITFGWRYWHPQSAGWWAHASYRIKLISDQSIDQWAQYMGRKEMQIAAESALGVVNAASRYQSLADQANQQSLQASQVKWEEMMEEARKAGLAGESAQTPAGPPQ